MLHHLRLPKCTRQGGSEQNEPFDASDFVGIQTPGVQGIAQSANNQALWGLKVYSQLSRLLWMKLRPEPYRVNSQAR